MTIKPIDKLMNEMVKSGLKDLGDFYKELSAEGQATVVVTNDQLKSIQSVEDFNITCIDGTCIISFKE